MNALMGGCRCPEFVRGPLHSGSADLRLRHHNLLKALGGFVERGKLFGIFQLLDRDVVSELKGRYMGFGRDALRKYTFQILLGTHFHHSRDRSTASLTNCWLDSLRQACVQMDPAHRSSCSQLLRHKYFTCDEFHH
ncbi:hypothetical protein NHX12_014114, partial [Muraenolepis orangiensis]